MSATTEKVLPRLAPVVFVFLWATGYIAAKFGTEFAEPFTFLAVRFSITFLILCAAVLVLLKPRFDRMQIFHSAVSGVFVHGLYLGGIFYAVYRGMPAGISALVVALQPFLTAIFAWFVLADRLPIAKGLYFFIALVGVTMVMFPNFNFIEFLPGITPETFGAAFLGTMAISFGAVYQKRNVKDLNVWVSTTSQFAGGAGFVLLVALLFETGQMIWNTQVVLTLAWLIFVLSIGAVALLMYLIRRDSSSATASLFYLVPVVATGMAWVLFGETLNTTQMIGSAIVVAAVWLSSKVK